MNIFPFQPDICSPDVLLLLYQAKLFVDHVSEVEELKIETGR
jgi:hypothetical protein